MLESDFCRFVFKDNTQADFLCSELHIDKWPPPEFLCIAGRNFQRRSFSRLSETGAQLSSTARGAYYLYVPEIHICQEKSS